MTDRSEDSSEKPSNHYERLQKKFREEERTYDNFKKVQIKLPFRMIVIGASGSGKTNAVIDLVEKINAFNKIMLFTKDIEEPLYAQFIDDMRQAEKDTKLEILTVGTKIEDLPKLDTVNKKDNNLLIVDDMVTEKHKALAGVVDYWIRGRKKNVSCIYLSQSYYEIPNLIRKNSNYIILSKISTNRDLHMILKEFQLGVTDEEMERLYLEATKNGFPNYFLIDITANASDKDENFRFRRNFTPLKYNHIDEKKEKEDQDEKLKKTFYKTSEGKKPPAESSRYVPGFAGQSGSRPHGRNPAAPAKSNGNLKQSHALNVPIPPPPPVDASKAEMMQYIKEISTALRDDDITMEQATEAMEDIPEKYGDYRDLLEMGDGFKKKKRKIGSGMYKKKRAKLSTETEKQLERMLGFRVRPYW